MAVLLVQDVVSDFSGITTNFASYARGFTIPSVYVPPLEQVFDSSTLNLPLTQTSISKNSFVIMKDYIDDFYYRIWISPSALDLGNIAGTINRSVTIWNAFFEPKDLTSVNQVSLTGVSDDAVAPQSLFSLGVYDFTVTISNEGASSIKGTYQLTVDGTVYNLPVVGSRVTPFLYKPDGEMIRSFLFQTHVKASHNNTEQRQRINRGARELLGFDIAVEGDDKRKLENLLYNWQSRVFAVPVWFEGQELSSAHFVDDLVINCDTDNLSFYVGSPAIITNGDVFEIMEIEEVTSNAITINYGLQNNFPAGSVIYPAVMCRMNSKQNLVQFSGESNLGRFNFISTKTQLINSDSFDTYRSIPIFPFNENWDNVPEWIYERKVKHLDNGRAEIKVDDQSGIPTINRNIEIALSNLSDIARFRAFLNEVKGRFKHFWIDHRTQDFQVLSDVISTGSNLTVVNNNYSFYVNSGIGKRDIVIELQDGTKLHRRISSAAVIDSNSETLALDQTFGQDIQASQIKRVSYLTLVRQQSDQTDIRYFLPDMAIIQYGLKGVVHDL